MRARSEYCYLSLSRNLALEHKWDINVHSFLAKTDKSVFGRRWAVGGNYTRLKDHRMYVALQLASIRHPHIGCFNQPPWDKCNKYAGHFEAAPKKGNFKIVGPPLKRHL